MRRVVSRGLPSVDLAKALQALSEHPLLGSCSLTRAESALSLTASSDISSKCFTLCAGYAHVQSAENNGEVGALLT